MGKDHLKRLATPKTWPIARKQNKYIIRPTPGAHSFETGMPLSFVLRDVLKIARSMREVRSMLKKDYVLVNKKPRKDPAFIVGLMDILELAPLKKQYMVIINKKQKLSMMPVDDPEKKFCRIKGKSMAKKGKAYLHLSDGHNIIAAKKEYNVNDTLIVNLPDYKIKEHFPFQKKASVLLVGGNHTGETGIIEDIDGKVVSFKDKEGNIYDVPRNYVFVIGKDKPSISFEEKDNE